VATQPPLETPKAHRLSPWLLARAREMRKDPTPAEEKLWWCLRDRRLCDLKFRRQTPSTPYIIPQQGK